MPETKQLLRETRDRIAPPSDVLGGLERRRRHQENVKRATAVVVGIVVALVGLGGWFALERGEAPTPAVPPEDLGIFAPVAGRIVYVNEGSDVGYGYGLWTIDPDGPSDTTAGSIVADDVASTLVPLDVEDAIPLDWSSDGTELLFVRTDPAACEICASAYLYVLHADGSETRLNEEPVHFGGADLSPDGERVVFAADGLYVVDADGGRPDRLPVEGSSPTFSPDGSQIAYLFGFDGDVVAGTVEEEHVWVANADGTNAHEILADEPTVFLGVSGLRWSPAGDRLAFGVGEHFGSEALAIYTFAPDGSDFTRVITGGVSPYWSPDGSQIAYTILCGREFSGGSCPEGSINRSQFDAQPDLFGGGSAGLAIADADGSNVREFGYAASGPWHPGAQVVEPAPAPTPTRVVLSGPSDLAYGIDGDVFVADADGSNAVRIADGVPVDGADTCANGEQRAEYTVFGTAWSPDGRYLAYWDWGCPVPPGAWGTVLISDPEGNVIASFPGQGWTIAWSPDSTRVAVWDSWGQGDATIGIYGLDGARHVALTVPSALMPAGDYSPVWSRDGASLLLPGVQVPLDGGTPEPLLTARWSAAYSPDGSRVAYVDDASLVVADADGPDAQEVGGPTEFWDVAWSPNGDRIAFVLDGELLVRDVTTGTETSLLDVTPSDRLQVIEFSPEGDAILFSRADVDSGETSLWSVNADGSDLRRLVAAIDWADLRPQGPTS
jgi:Tol biopolymer transport system component